MRYSTALLLTFTLLLTACSPAPDPVVIEKLEKIIEVREKIVEETDLLFQLGKADPGPSLIALSKAKVALATEQKDVPAIITELELIVERLKELLDREQSLVEENRHTQTEISQRFIQVTEAEIRLQRAKTKYGFK